MQEIYNWFEKISIASVEKVVLKRIANSFVRGGFDKGLKDIKDLKGKSYNDLRKIKNLGEKSVAIVIVVLEHYNMHILVPPVDTSNKKDKELMNLIDQYRKEIVTK